ncbi:hypothetical protein E2C01_016679 [Portunus trituberculatus]|uniref:Uncharacterized protein n=1 Tax=Portunus trituberculatus TaxID=210409 RepID=A0A5B7DQ42_PORTR|nr:hypothetical protein [Portunus trituberculatus]
MESQGLLGGFKSMFCAVAAERRPISGSVTAPCLDTAKPNLHPTQTTHRKLYLLPTPSGVKG